HSYQCWPDLNVPPIRGRALQGVRNPPYPLARLAADLRPRVLQQLRAKRRADSLEAARIISGRGDQVSIQLTPRRFTAAEYRQMIQAGLFAEDERLELIDGEVVEMSPIGDRHAACVRRLIALLSR